MCPEWKVFVNECGKSTKLFEKFDVLEYQRKKTEFMALPNEEKMNYKGVDGYIEAQGGDVPSSLQYGYIKLYEEINARLGDNKGNPEKLQIDSLLQRDSIQDLLASLENEEYIKSIYKLKKKQVKAGGLNSTEANKLMECLRQGRSLFLAGANADMLAKPLIDFYAANAYAYAIIVINSPLHKAMNTLKGSHGHTYNHEKGTVDFGGEIPSGTFLDLMCALPIAEIHNESMNLKYSLLDSVDLVQHNSFKLSLPALLAMVPELNDYYVQIYGDHHLVHQLSIDTGVTNSSVTYNFYIGDGVTKPSKDKLKIAFKDSTISEEQGSYKVSVTAENISSIMPCIYHDIKGKLWYIESPVNGLVLPELCLHFLIISALCNIMRYSPHEWSNILTNRISSQYSLLISKYLRLFEIKYPMLVAELLTEFSPIVIGN